jgi:hypothetical protein
MVTFALPIAAKEKTPAFPGAEGFARYITGGRGGTVYHVTSLADDGSAGTLRWAVSKSGTRTIVFDVSGTIHLTSALPINQSNVTIAGQTAPGDGICVTDYPFNIKANNVIVRYIRIRLGNTNVTVDGADGWDGFGGFDQSEIMIDHCSISWSIDECCSVLGNKTSTVQWCLVSQSLQDAGHSKGSHGYGGNWGGSGASFHHNLMCHHESRVPRLGPRPTTQMDERMDMRNNVLYNWGGNGCYGGENMNVNIVNNYYKPGPATAQRSTTIQRRIAGIGIRTTEYVTNSPDYAPALHKWGKFFVDGNVNSKYSDVTNDNWTYGIYNQISSSDNDGLYTQTTKDTMKLSAPIAFIHTTTHDAATAYTKVLKYAGCCINRDWIDTLMIHDTTYGVATYTGTSGKFTGDATNHPGIIDSQYDNKPADAAADWSPWPTLSSTTAPTDTDGDGMPDTWETAHGLNPNDASDGNTVGSDGYTNLENYLNGIVTNITSDELEGGTVMGTDEEAGEAPVTATYELSQATNSTNTSSEYTFNNGFSITNTKGKGYATGSNNGIKYSSGTQYTIVIPTNFTVTAVEFIGYDNYADVDAYLGELGGVTYTSTQYVFPQKDASGTTTTKDYNVTLTNPATGTLTFTPQGKQVVWKIILTVTTSTGIKKIYTVDASSKNIYTTDGRLIKNNASDSDINSLSKGIYIIGNKTRIVK